MKKGFIVPTVVLIIAAVSTAAISLLGLKSEITKQDLTIIAAVQKNIKIRPINTSCRPLVSEKSIYLRSNLICEKRDGQWWRLGYDLPCNVAVNLEPNEARKISISRHPNEVMMNDCRVIGGKKVCTLAPSLYTQKSCNNDI
jgi:hypothetical protein